MSLNATEMKKLFNRVYKNEMIEDAETKLHDADSIKAVCLKVFGDGGSNPDPSLLHNFNNLVVEMANEVAKPMVTEMLGIFANVVSANRGDVKQIKTPNKIKAKVMWSANGSGVDLIRVAGSKSVTAVPKVFTTGFYYEPLDLVQDSVESFRTLVDDIAMAKVRLYMKEISKLTAAAVTATTIPANNVLSGANNSITNYNKLVSRMSRLGGKPILVADSVLIDDLAMKQVGDATISKIFPESYKNELFQAMNVTSIGRSTALNLVNPFIDEANSIVELNVQEGFMFAGDSSQKVFSVVEYAGMRQNTETELEAERIKIKIAQDASIILVYPTNIAYIKDTALSL
jgi:hypothetical protein